jgi:hypothetical protein
MDIMAKIAILPRGQCGRRDLLEKRSSAMIYMAVIGSFIW